MAQTKQKRIKLDNGKTILVENPIKKGGKNPFKELANLMSNIPNLQPCD